MSVTILLFLQTQSFRGSLPFLRLFYVFFDKNMSSPAGVVICKKCNKGTITCHTSGVRNPHYGCRFEVCSTLKCHYKWLTPPTHFPPSWRVCKCGKPCRYFESRRTFYCFNDTCDFKEVIAVGVSVITDHSQCVLCNKTSSPPPTSFCPLPSPSVSSSLLQAPSLPETPNPSSRKRLFSEEYAPSDHADAPSSRAAFPSHSFLPDWTVALPIIAWVSQPDGALRMLHLAVLAGMQVTFEPFQIGIQWRLPSPIPPEQETIYSGFSLEIGSSGTDFTAPCFQRLDAGFIPTPFLIDIGKIDQSQRIAPWVTYSVPELLPVIKL